MKNKKLIIILMIVAAISVIGGYYVIQLKSLQEINKVEMKVDDYINYSDQISGNKDQVNWKYVASVIGVIEKNKFKNVSESQIKEVASLFIKKEKKVYKLNSLDSVVEELDFSKSEKKRVHDYVEDLKDYGITPSKLKSDTKYMKFINGIKEGAIKNYKKYKILPSITIAQAILETGWGNSDLAGKYNNLFGIKADKSWTGQYVTLETSEFSNTIINDKFRKYEDKNQSIYDHAKFLYENKRYKENGVFEANTYKVQANALQEAGYSTLMDNNGEKIYSKKLIQLIQQYNLQLIDNEAQSIN